MKITILWSSLAGYSVAFFKELALRGCSIQLIYQVIESDAPYKPFDLSFCKMAIQDSVIVKNNLESLVHDFDPACILMSSWAFPHYMKLTKKMRGKGVFVIAAMDNQWRGNLRQYIGIILSKFYLRPSIDTFFVTGDRQANFAYKLGYNDVLYGYGAADIKIFHSSVKISERPKNFLFIGRLLPIKGIEALHRAYLAYREQVADPWGLKVAGIGPLNELLRGAPGIELLGFVQPADLPELMRMARCFVLPSRWEQWGVAIHEAAAAGLPIIATRPCGAVTMFVRDGVNGYVVSPQPQQLTRAMVRISLASQTVLERMSIASSTLANLSDLSKIAEYFLDNIGDFVERTSPNT